MTRNAAENIPEESCPSINHEKRRNLSGRQVLKKYWKALPKPINSARKTAADKGSKDDRNLPVRGDQTSGVQVDFLRN